MTLLKQQNSIHSNTHVNQIDTITGSSSTHKGKILSITGSVNKTNSSEWILDLGATDHVTTFFTHFLLTRK